MALPSIALASPVAFFQYVNPAPGSSSIATSRMLSVTVYDRYGVRYMANMTMSLDGVKVTPTWKPWAGYGFRKFTLKYAAMNMSVGTHTAAVRIHDRANHTVNYSWSFNVAASDSAPPVTTSQVVSLSSDGATILLHATDSGSGVAHTYYTLDGVAGEGAIVFTSVAGPHVLVFWSVDVAGNTEAHHTLNFTVAPAIFAHAAPANACTVVGCHGGKDVATIHLAVGCTPCHAPGVTPTTNCTVCHGANGPADHLVHVTVSSVSTPACTQAGCHTAALVGIHATCATCHDSTDATVVAAIAAGGAHCETCHGVQAVAHVAIGTAHTVTGSCFASTCHGTDVTKMHGNDFRGSHETPPGCAACHGAGKTPSTNCATCHPDLVTPHDYVTAHAAVTRMIDTNSSACVACHGDDLTKVLPADTYPDYPAAEHKGCSCHAYFEAGQNEGNLPAGQVGCQNCHANAHYSAHGFGKGFTASGHNTTYFGIIGGKSKFDGSQGVTLHTIETSATSPNLGRVATLTTDWELPTLNVFWPSTDASAPVGAKKGLTWTSVVTCQDCHTGLSAAGPHGAAQNWGIDPNYPGDFSYAELSKWIITNPSGIKVRSTLSSLLPAQPTQASWIASGYAYFSGVPTTDPAINFDGQNHAIICSKCHRLYNFQSGFKDERAPSAQNWKLPSGVATDTVTGKVNTSAIGGSNTAHGQTHFDSNTGAPQCVNCHIAIPHGWKRPRLIVNSGPGKWVDNQHVMAADPAPYRSPNQLGTDDGQAALGWGSDLDKHPAAMVGMQSISGTDEHELIASSGGSNAPGTYTGLNTNYIEWEEYKCGACDFHHPYTDSRVGYDTVIVKE